MAYRLLSLDLFQTLVNLDTITASLWNRVLGRPCKPEEVVMLSHLLQEGYKADYREMTQHPPFVSMEKIFKIGFQHVIEKTGLCFSPDEAALAFVEEHNHASFFSDTAELFRKLSGKIPIALSSDADEGMVSGLLEKIPCQYVFLSQRLGCYKRDKEGRFFRQILQTTGFSPEEVLHVGDSLPDIVGPSICGIASCHLCRENSFDKVLPENLSPTYRISSLLQLPGLVL